MAEYFRSPKDLGHWVKSKESSGSAFDILMGVISENGDSPELALSDELDIKESCLAIYDGDENAEIILFKILARHKLTQLKERSLNMDKKAQTSRQRNDWVKGERNKWNRVVDGFDSATPWRVDRDQFYDFTHYHTDAISFDENPNRVYSGEALWRMYVMDKFYREYKTADGKWVGGYINDRFHVFPDAGTPANQDVPRDGGNPMGLGINERTRKPRPHQYSTERRLEEARGEKTEDLIFSTPVASSFTRVMKTASVLPEEREDDSVYNIFRDCIEMKEAGITYDEIIDRVSSHYDASITGVAEIAKFADTMVERHDGIAYEFGKTANVTLQQQTPATNISNNTQVTLLDKTVLGKNPDGTYQVLSGQGAGTFVAIDESNLSDGFLDDDIDSSMERDMDDLGLNEKSGPVDSQDLSSMETDTDFPIQENS